MKDLKGLSHREKQILDVIYGRDCATASEVADNFPEDVGFESIRKLIRILEKKGFLVHKKKGRAYVYYPTFPKEEASKSAMKKIIETYYQYSVPHAVSTLLNISKDIITREDMEEILEMIRNAMQNEY